jgi:hypothetical protein
MNQESSLPKRPPRGGGDIGVGEGAMEVGARRGFAKEGRQRAHQVTGCNRTYVAIVSMPEPLAWAAQAWVEVRVEAAPL